MMFEKINITELAVIISLGVALVMAIFYNMENLAGIIVGGLAGYIGGRVIHKGGNEV
jgi:hypothetical protein